MHPTRDQLQRVILAIVTLAGLLSAQQGRTLRNHIPGPNGGMAFGASMDRLGDLDRDGVEDYAIGAPGDRAGTGTVWVFSGRTGSFIRLIPGRGTGNLFGQSLAGCGDVNRDGFKDMIVGAPQWNLSKPGYARVHSGKDGSVIYRFDGLANGNGFGEAVACVGDVNRDGTPDVAVLAPKGKKSGTTGGYVHVFSGRNGTRLWSRHYKWNNVPRDVQGIGDANRDGYADWAVTADTPSGGHSIAFYSGKDGLFFKTINGAGSSVCGLGDLNGDGYPEVAIGSQYAAGSKGVVDITSTRTWSRLYQITGANAGDYFGRLVRPGDDVDKDGYRDLIVGKRTRGTFVHSGKTGRLLFWCKPAANYVMSACCVSDLDRDGFPDFMFGNSPETVGGKAGTGAARVIRGQAPIPDLVATSLKSSSSVVYSGQYHTFTYGLSNRGFATSGAFRVGFWLDATFLGYASFSSLAVGTTTKTIRLRMPTIRISKGCRLTMQVDYSKAVKEALETNNVASISLACSAGLPDLVPTAVSAVPTDASRRRFRLMTSVSNIGVVGSSSTLVAYYLSRDSSLGAGDTLIGSAGLPAIARGTSANSTITYRTVPSTIAAGSYFIIARVDPSNRVRERNEGNNLLARAVTIRALPTDVVLSALTIRSGARAGALASIDYKVSNTSSQPTGNISLQIRLNNYTLTSARLTSLAANASVSGTLRVLLPACQGAGPLTLIGIATPAAFELDRSDNSRSAATTIAAFSGAPRLERREDAREHSSLSAQNGSRANLCVAASAHRGHWALTVLSLQSTTPIDGASALSLSLLNTPSFPKWFWRTSSTTGLLDPAFVLPKGLVTGPLNLYARTILFRPDFSALSGSTNVHAFLIR